MAELVPMFPLSTVLLPGGLLPLHIFEERYREMTRACLAGDRRFGVVLITRGSEVGGGERRAGLGSMARIEEARTLADGRSLLLVRGTGRVAVTEWLPDDPYPRALIEPLADRPAAGEVAPALSRATAAVRRARELLSEYEGTAVLRAAPSADPETVGWWLCEQAPLSVLDRQHLLECPALEPRLELLVELAEAASGDLERLLAGG